jgi:hypothetical protein
MPQSEVPLLHSVLSQVIPFWILDWGFWIGEALRSQGFSLRTAASSVSIGMTIAIDWEYRGETFERGCANPLVLNFLPSALGGSSEMRTEN